MQVLPDDQDKVHVYRIIDTAAKDRLVARILMQCRLLQFSENVLNPMTALVWPWSFAGPLFGSHSLFSALSLLLILLAVGVLHVVRLNWRSWFFDRLGELGSRIDPAAGPVRLLVRDAATWRAMPWACRPAILRAIPWAAPWGLAIGSAGTLGIAFAACTPWAWVSPTAFGVSDLGLCHETRQGDMPIWLAVLLAVVPVALASLVQDHARYAAAGPPMKSGFWRASAKSS